VSGTFSGRDNRPAGSGGRREALRREAALARGSVKAYLRPDCLLRALRFFVVDDWVSRLSSLEGVISVSLVPSVVDHAVSRISSLVSRMAENLRHFYIGA
jgi:hypothetical protein